MASKYVPGQLGLFRPQSAWAPPQELPDLRGRPLVALDTETLDRGLENGLGPGWPMGLTQIYGVAFAAEGCQGYIPLRHPDSPNFPIDNVLRWVSDLHLSGTRIVYHNSPYDCGTLGSVGVANPVNLEDTLAAAVMLDENHRAYNLDACCAREGIPGKDLELLRQAVTACGGNPAKPAADLWRVPARYAGPYAEQDTVATLALWQQYEGALKAQGVWDAYRLEVDLIPMVVAMRRRGIRVNTGKAVQAAKRFRDEGKRLIELVSDRIPTGRKLSIDDFRSPGTLAKLFAHENLTFPRTEKTNQPSFSNDWMADHPHWLPQAVTKIRTYEDSASKFFETFLLRFAHRGRIHAEVHQFKSDEGGTRSHRFSYSDPPLQQAPSPKKSKHTGIGLAFRDCFEPEPGELWGAPDYSSQEPRITVHFAAACKCRGVERVVDEYCNNPRTDYHAVVADMIGKDREIAKIFNLAMTYGFGIQSIANQLKCSVSEAQALSKDYHDRLPYIKELENLCKRRANERGYIRLIDGARMRYPNYDGPYLEFEVRQAALAAGKQLFPCSLEEARRRQDDSEHPWYGQRLRRADTRTALNNLIQGSAARQTKTAMRNLWHAGYLPLIQMHDELGFSITTEKQLNEISEIMINAIPLKVPVVVDAEVGKTWGQAVQTWDKFVSEHGKEYGLQTSAA